MRIGIREAEREQFLKELDALAAESENELRLIDDFDRDAIGDSIRRYEEKKKELWDAYESGERGGGDEPRKG